MKALVFGEIIWDVYPDGAVLGGAPFNFCAHCVQCGGKGALLSAVGRDERGAQARTALRHPGVETAL